MSFDYSLIYLFIGFLGGVVVCIFIGVITYSTAFVVVVSSSIGVILSATVSKIISDEVKRKRDHTEKNKEKKEEKIRNHILRQILPLLDEWSDLKIYNANVWQDMALMINIGNYDYFINRDYFTESKSHLENYPIIWEEWQTVNKLIESVNKNGNLIKNSLEINLEQKFTARFSKLTTVKKGGNIKDNQYLFEGILQRIIYRRIYELLNGIDYNEDNYIGEKKRDSISIGNQDLVKSDSSTLDEISNFFIDLSRNFDNHFPNHVEKIKDHQKRLVKVHSHYEAFNKGLKLLISKIDSGDAMLGKCSICKDW